MKHTKNARTPLTRIGLSIRVFFLSLLLMGSLLAFASTLAADPIFAQGASQVARQHVTRPQSLTTLSTLSTHKKLLSKKHPAPITSSTHRGAITAPFDPTPTATPIPPLGLTLVASVIGGPTFEVGQTLVTHLDITNTTASTIFDSTSGIIVRNALALGTANIAATGTGWNFTLNSPNGPALLSATYSGAPVIPGGTFPTIVVTRSLTNDAVPVLTGNISVSDSLNPNTNLATTSVRVYPSTQTPTVTATVTQSATPTPTTLSVPGISINPTVMGGPNFQAGQTFTLDLNVTNTNATTTLDSTSGVGIGVAVPLGLTNIVASGSGWFIAQNVAVGPGLLVATYAGPPVAPGNAFLTLEVTGLLTSDAAPTLSITSGVSDLGNPGANTVTTNVNVSSTTPTAVPDATTTTTSTATSTVTVVATGTPTPSSSGETITSDVIVGPNFQVGQPLTWDLNVSNANLSASLDASSDVSIFDVLPSGLSAIAVTGNNWTITNFTSTTSPALLSAVYTGPAVIAGSAFPPLEITGTLTSDAVPTWTNTAGVSDTLHPVATLTSFSVNVSPANQTATAVPSVTATVVTAVPSATATALKPQLYITNSTTGGGTYYVGQTLNYGLVITNLPSSLAENQPITVDDVFSVGLTHMVATGNNWTISLSSTTSPTLMTATYNGPYPVTDGMVLPMISISGDLTEAAVPSLTSDATVRSADDPNPSLNTSINTITILASPASPTVTSTTTATASVTTTATASVTPTATASVTTTATASVTSTATMTTGTTPDLSIVKVNLGGDHFNVGDKVTYVIIVSNAFVGGVAISPITVSDVIPLGLSNIEVQAPLWNVSVSDHSSPAIITANYNGSFPVAAGQVLSSITISGTLNANAVPSLTDTATVDSLGDINGDNTATDTVFVKQDNKNDQNHNTSDNKNHQHNNHSQNRNDGSNGNDGKNGSNGNGGKDGSDGSSSSPDLPATGGSPIGGACS